MVKSNKPGKYLACFVILLLAGIFFIVSNNDTILATNQVDQVINSSGEFIKQNPKLLLQSVKSVENFYNVSNNTLAWVNEIPISSEEFLFRQGLKKANGDKFQDDQSVFNILVEEKAILDYAIKNNLVPTDAELEKFINYERNFDNTGEEYQNMVQAFSKQTGITEDEYYNTYEKYNAFRVLLLENVYKYKLEDGLKNGKISFDNDVFTQAKEEKAYWNDVKMEIKTAANIKYNNKYKDLNLMVDDTKIYK